MIDDCVRRQDVIQAIYNNEDRQDICEAVRSLEPAYPASDDCISKQAVIEMAYDMSEIDGEHFTEPCMVVDVEDIQKLPSVNPQEPCEDVISRQAVLDDVLKASNLKKFDWIIDARKKVKAMSSVTPTERIEYGTDGNAYKLSISNGKEFERTERTGHWTTEWSDIDREERHYCSECGKWKYITSKYCPDCGARMVGDDNE